MNISVSLIDYVGVIDDGVAVILSLMLNDKPYEIIYWFNPKNDFRINIEQSFYDDFPNIKNLYEYEYLLDLLFHIDTQVLPDRKEIFTEFFDS